MIPASSLLRNMVLLKSPSTAMLIAQPLQSRTRVLESARRGKGQVLRFRCTWTTSQRRQSRCPLRISEQSCLTLRNRLFRSKWKLHWQMPMARWRAAIGVLLAIWYLPTSLVVHIASMDCTGQICQMPEKSLILETAGYSLICRI